MRSIDSDLKKKDFKHIYLLYGKEPYLIRRYKRLLTQAFLPHADDMNLTRFIGREVDETAIIETANTMPFFAPCRVIVVEDTGIPAKKSEKMVEAFDHLPETTYMIFVEESIDKRMGFYKKVVKFGRVEELNRPDEKTLTQWMLQRVQKAGLAISRDAWNDFYVRSGDSMDNMSNEMNKLISYCIDKEAIRKNDVEDVCVNWIEERIFELMEAIASKNPHMMMKLYKDMLLMHEEPLHILAVLRSQFLKLLLLKEMDRHREPDREISARTKIPSFFLRKNRNLAGNFTIKELEELLIDIGNLEADMKTGRVNMQIGLELLMTKYAMG